MSERLLKSRPSAPNRIARTLLRQIGVHPDDREPVKFDLRGRRALTLATNHGVLAHPLASDAELAFIKKCLHAPARIGTVNHGHGLVGAGLAANQNGAAVGSRTTGIELGRIDEALGFLEKETQA